MVALVVSHTPGSHVRELVAAVDTALLNNVSGLSVWGLLLLSLSHHTRVAHSRSRAGCGSAQQREWAERVGVCSCCLSHTHAWFTHVRELVAALLNNVSDTVLLISSRVLLRCCLTSCSLPSGCGFARQRVCHFVCATSCVLCLSCHRVSCCVVVCPLLSTRVRELVAQLNNVNAFVCHDDVHPVISSFVKVSHRRIQTVATEGHLTLLLNTLL